jgi:hypothetical protein
MSPTSKGLAPTQYTSGSAGSAGSLALVGAPTLIASAVNFGASVTLALNVSNEGTYDWLVVLNALGAASDNYFAQNYRWKKSRGELIVPQGLKWSYSSDIAFGGAAQGPIGYIANAGDDGGDGSGTSASFPLTSPTNRAIGGVFQNVTTVVPLGYGFRLRIPIGTAIRTVNLYSGCRSQVNKTSTITIAAHLLDGSAGDVSTNLISTSGAGGATYFVWKTVFQAKGGAPTDLIISQILTASTGVTGVAGDAVVLAAVTIS